MEHRDADVQRAVADDGADDDGWVWGASTLGYAYDATNNNGKIIRQDYVPTGEQVVMTYDSLNRLSKA